MPSGLAGEQLRLVIDTIVEAVPGTEIVDVVARSEVTILGFDEASFDSTGPEGFAVGVHRYLGPSVPLEPGQRLFTFLH